MSSDPVSPVGAAKPELTISAPALNDEPVELEGSPIAARQATSADRNNESGDVTAQESKAREKVIEERKGDPSVLVDVPSTPSAEEFGRSEDAEAET